MIPVNGSFTSGSVSAAHGVNGILTALLAFVCGTEVEDEALSGSGTTYSGSLSNFPVGSRRVVLKYSVGGEDYEITDDGEGEFADDTITSATIDYTDGSYSIVFVGSPTSVVMDYIYGEDGRDWSLKFLRNTRDNAKTGTPGEPFGSNCQECILYNTGLSGLEDVYIGFREWEYPVGNAYGIDLNGYLFYEDEEMYWNDSYLLHGRDTYNTTWKRFAHPMLPLINAPMNYWFYSNRQRIIIVVKVQSNYESAYLGFCNRLHSPNEYPYPLYIKGSMSGNASFSSTTSHDFILANLSYVAPHQMGVLPNNSFQPCNVSAAVILLYPLATWSGSETLDKIPDSGEYFTSQASGVFQLTGSDPINLWDMDGVFAVFGTLLQSEDVVKNYTILQRMRIFQNIHRNTQIDFMGIVEDNFTTTTTTSSTTSSTTTTTTTA